MLFCRNGQANSQIHVEMQRPEHSQRNLEKAPSFQTMVLEWSAIHRQAVNVDLYLSLHPKTDSKWITDLNKIWNDKASRKKKRKRRILWPWVKDLSTRPWETIVVIQTLPTLKHQVLWGTLLRRCKHTCTPGETISTHVSDDGLKWQEKNKRPSKLHRKTTNKAVKTSATGIKPNKMQKGQLHRLEDVQHRLARGKCNLNAIAAHALERPQDGASRCWRGCGASGGVTLCVGGGGSVSLFSHGERYWPTTSRPPLQVLTHEQWECRFPERLLNRCL